MRHLEADQAKLLGKKQALLALVNEACSGKRRFYLLLSQEIKKILSNADQSVKDLLKRLHQTMSREHDQYGPVYEVKMPDNVVLELEPYADGPKCTDEKSRPQDLTVKVRHQKPSA